MKTPEEIKKENPFRVPEGYFESMTERMMKAVKERGEAGVQQEEKSVRKLRLSPFFSLAAAIIGFAIITSVMVRLLSDRNESILSNSENELFADVFAEEIDTYMIESEYSSSDTDTSEAGTISTEAIIDYLVQENIELTDIYELYN